MASLYLVTTALLYVLGNEGSCVSAQTHYTIETLVIIDKFAFNEWNGYVQTILLDKDRADQPTAIITDYINSLFLGVNAIYQGLAKYEIYIDVRIVGIKFVTVPLTPQVPFDGKLNKPPEKCEDETVVTGTPPGSGMVNEDTILDQFDLWLSTQNFPPVDHTILITGLEMYEEKEGGDQNNTIGKGTKGGMCGIKSRSIVENIPDDMGSIAIAHSLALSLNASEDGDGNTCSNATMNLMAHTSARNTSNVYRFSSCSIDYIRNMLAHLDSQPGGNCLAPERTTALRVDGVQLGKLFTADQLCQMAKGSLSRVCRSLYGHWGEFPYSTVCTELWCSAADDSSTCQNIRAGDGMPCGNHKECSLGECVESATAPASSDTCPFGDSPWYPGMPVFKSYPDDSCSDLTARSSSVCYQESPLRMCCGSCEALYTGTPGCEYGDKQNYCATMDYPYDCALNDEACCESCKPYYNASLEGCEYGDRTADCQKLMFPRDCYNNHQACCGSCHQYLDPSNIGCEFGDKHPDCSHLNYPYTCYSNGDVCCGSCAQYRDDTRVGCEYGDKNPGCGDFLATDRSRCHTLSETCCASCAEPTPSPTSDLIG